MQQSIVKFYCFVVQTLLNMFRALLCPSLGARQNCRCSLWFPYECGGGSVLSRGRLRTLPPPHSYGNQRLQGQFDGLLMMGIVMPETCWAVSVRQGNKILQLIVASSWVFLFEWLKMHETTNPKMFISILYMFRAAMCPSSGELIVSIRHLVYVTLYSWPFGVQVWMRLIQTCTPNGHLYRVTHIPYVVLIQLILLMMGTWLPETCRE